MHTMASWWLGLMEALQLLWPHTSKGSLYSSRMTSTFIKTVPFSSLTLARNTTECKSRIQINKSTKQTNITFLNLHVFSPQLHLILKFWDVYRNHFLIMLEGEATGRLLRYDPPTGKTHVVLDSLAFPNGVQFSEDHSFLLFTETTNCRYHFL